MSRHRPFRLLAAFLSAAGGVSLRGAEPCVPVDTAARDRLIAYVRRMSQLPPEAPLSLTQEDLVPGTCYRKLVFTVSGMPRQVKLVLAPDQRFLAPEILDSAEDPLAEAALVSEKVRAWLRNHQVPSLGSPTAPVTLVFISDFQCPFCKRARDVLAEEMKERPDAWRNSIAVAYLNFPLSGHAWARKAAEAGACVASQNNGAFWSLYGFLFDRQQRLTSDNIAAAIREEVRSEGLDVTRFDLCVTGDWPVTGSTRTFLAPLNSIFPARQRSLQTANGCSD
ncbi:MAG: thioredoxin domain-containing protein [Bryobacteraceae bacterium]|jgi:glutaredoxin